jgi:hypothetical protein
MLGEKISDLASTAWASSVRAPCSNFGELIVKASWLNQLGNVIVGHGIIAPSTEKWRLQAPPRYAALPIRAVTNFQR